MKTGSSSRSQPPNGSAGLSFTARIAGWSARHRWPVLAASATVIFLAVVAIIAIGTDLRDDDEGVGESGKAVELMEERFRSEPVPDVDRVPRRTERLIFSNPSLQVDDPLFRSTVDTAIKDLRALPGVTLAISYYDTGEPDMLADDRHAVLGWVTLEGSSVGNIEPVQRAIESAEKGSSGFEIGVVSFGLIEDEFEEIIEEDFSRILFISLGLGLIILLLAFRAVVAAVIPLAMAIGAILQRHRRCYPGKQGLPACRSIRGNDSDDGPGSWYRLFPIYRE